MSFVDDLKTRLRKEEGLRLKPYRCSAGKLSIGYGRNLEDVGISIDEAEFLLENDINKTFKELDKKLPWWRSLSERRQLVLADMAFNMGTGEKGLMSFKNTLKLIETGKYPEAASAMLQSKWAVQVGNRAKDLAEMMRLG